MRYELLIGIRYLRAKRKEAFISLITVISALGVTLGVMTLNVALAIMTGFEEDLRDRILGFNPHVLVLTVGGGLPDHQRVVDDIKAQRDVEAAGPFVFGQAMLSSGDQVTGSIIRGVDADADEVTEIRRHLLEGTLEDLRRTFEVAIDDAGHVVRLPGIIVGKEITRQLGLGVGEVVSVISPLVTPTAVGMLPRIRRFVIAGVFDSGMAEYDASLAYMDLQRAQSFFELGDTVTGIEVRGKHLYKADQLAERIQAQLGFPFRVRNWMEINHNLFSALKLEKTVYFIVLLLIVLVAAFNIVATLIMVVMEKRKDIAILKSMGATAKSVGRIFIFKGMVVGLVGTALGNVLGYIACWLLERYEFIDLPEGVFYVNTVPVRMYPEYFAMVTFASLVICLLATIYPARQAARLSPVDVIRYE